MLILASNSPRRKEILEMLGYEFIVSASDCDENLTIDNPENMVRELSERKALGVKRTSNDTVIGSDTVVYLENKILLKPKNKDDAKKMLSSLSGKNTRYLQE